MSRNVRIYTRGAGDVHLWAGFTSSRRRTLDRGLGGGLGRVKAEWGVDVADKDARKAPLQKGQIWAFFATKEHAEKFTAAPDRGLRRHRGRRHRQGGGVMAFGERMNRKHAERKRERSAERRWQKQLENQPQDDYGYDYNGERERDR
jgi:hypothetical protein